jgi:hypothetical protein
MSAPWRIAQRDRAGIVNADSSDQEKTPQPYAEEIFSAVSSAV